MEITKPRKKKDIVNDKRRALSKEKLISGSYSPLQYFNSIESTLGNVNYLEEPDLSDSDISNDSDSSVETELEVRNSECVVCLQRRDTTYLFLPCRHANCCKNCSDMLEQQDQRCPTCRTKIDSRLQIFSLINA